MKTSDNKIFYGQGNISHPAPAAWKDLVDAFIRQNRLPLLWRSSFPPSSRWMASLEVKVSSSTDTAP
jgi:hypothetical protein